MHGAREEQYHSNDYLLVTRTTTLFLRGTLIAWFINSLIAYFLKPSCAVTRTN